MVPFSLSFCVSFCHCCHCTVSRPPFDPHLHAQLVPCVGFECIVSCANVTTNHTVGHVAVYKKCGRTKCRQMGKYPLIDYTLADMLNATKSFKPANKFFACNHLYLYSRLYIYIFLFWCVRSGILGVQSVKPIWRTACRDPFTREHIPFGSHSSAGADCQFRRRGHF